MTDPPTLLSIRCPIIMTNPTSNEYPPLSPNNWHTLLYLQLPLCRCPGSCPRPLHFLLRCILFCFICFVLSLFVLSFLRFFFFFDLILFMFLFSPPKGKPTRLAGWFYRTVCAIYNHTYFTMYKRPFFLYPPLFSLLAPYCTALHVTVSYYTVRNCLILYCTALNWLYHLTSSACFLSLAILSFT